MHNLDVIVERPGDSAPAGVQPGPIDFLSHPIIFTAPSRFTPGSAWHEHIPFAMAAVDLVRPKLLVELGTAAGDSYCAFCQAVQQLNLNTQCYAIDTWQGDPHSGPSGPEVLQDLRAWHDPRYGTFSRLVQSTFDDALVHFADGSIDLLHLDGFHQYDVVRHDFESWLPKLSDRGVVLMHDVNAPQPDFGVDVLWRELRGRYPHFEFAHGHGLGVLAVGKNPPAAIRRLCDASASDAAGTRDLFFALGNRLTILSQRQQLTETLEAARSRRAAAEEVVDALKAQVSAAVAAFADHAAKSSETTLILARELEKQTRTVEKISAEVAALAHQVETRDRAIADKTETIDQLTKELRNLEQHAARLTDEHLIELEAASLKLRAETGAKENERVARAGLQREINGLAATVNAMKATAWWQLACRAHLMRLRIAPPNSTRERAWSSVRRLIHRGVAKPPSMVAASAVSTTELGPILEPPRRESAGGPGGTSADRLLREKLKIFLDRIDARLVFPVTADPLVSILIATWNRAEYLFQCLESILAHTDVPFEVIVVDDASTDTVPALSARCVNVRTIRHAENAGFVKSYNAAAEAARGRYLMFLNNDVIVMPGWLSALVATAERDPDCGAVGGKLIRPDGTLQEAGSILWQDGSALGYGRDDDPTKPEYSYVREVDFISAAYLLVRTDDFRTLGGFDLRFAPAYYEDSDLCMGLRSLGRKVVYQPRGTVIHYEFGTHSGEGSRLLCAQNQPKFRQKWEADLQRHQRSGNVLRARDAREGKRLLIINDQIPAAYLGAGLPRDRDLVEFAASLGYRVTFVPTDAAIPWLPITSQLQQMGVEVIHDRSVGEVFHARTGLYDVVLISRPHNAEKYLGAARTAFPNARIIYDAEALYANREILQAPIYGDALSPSEQERLVRQEVDLITQADAIIAVSEAERDIIRRVEPATPVFIWGAPHEWRQPTRGFADRRDLLFVGTFRRGHGPNTDAAIRFRHEVLPKIRQQLPDVRFLIVGSEPSEHIRALAGPDVIVTGFVEDLRQYYEACRVSVVPIRFGAGINYKLSEAMSHGIPSVVSPVAAQGLGLTDGREVLIGRDDDDFAAKVVRLYHDEDLWTRLQQAERQYIEEHCDVVAMRKQLANIFEAV